MSSRPHGPEALKTTSQDKGPRGDHIRMPNDDCDHTSGKERRVESGL
ncbi:hypothetical protein ACWD4F_27510 [Streptomyces aureus]